MSSKRLLLALVLSLISTTVFAGGFDELKAAKLQFAQSDKSAAARLIYVKSLADILGDATTDRMTGGRGDDGLIMALWAELAKYPAPKDSDSKALTKLRTGRWQSPRHTYIFSEDGTWRLAPEDGTTHGGWSIKGNQSTESWSGNSEKQAYTIILLDKKYFITTDGQDVFSSIDSKRAWRYILIKNAPSENCRAP